MALIACCATIWVRVVLPHGKMFPDGDGVASPKCSLRRPVDLVHFLVDGHCGAEQCPSTNIDRLRRRSGGGCVREGRSRKHQRARRLGSPDLQAVLNGTQQGSKYQRTNPYIYEGVGSKGANSLLEYLR